MKVFLFVFFFLLSFFYFLFPIEGDGDIFHHMNTGRYVVEHHTLPQVDEFTFSQDGKPWVGYAWGAGTVFYLLYSSLGPVSVNILVSLLAVFTLVLLFCLLRLYKISFWISFLVVLFITPVLSIRWPTRPELFTYPFLLMLLLVNQLRHRFSAVLSLFPFVMLLWVNTYGSSAIMGLFILLYFAGFQFYLDGFIFQKKHILFYSSIVISILVSFFNGYGWRTVFYIFLIPQIAHNQSEWGGIFKNLTAANDYVLTFQYLLLIYLLYLVFLILVIVFSWKYIKKDLLYPGLLALFVVIPFVAFRQLLIGILLSAPFLALLLSHQTKKLKMFIPIALGILVVSSLVNMWVFKRGIGESTTPYSKKMITFIRDHQLYGRSFNNQQIGGFLTYHLYPNIKIFYDTRDDLYLGSTVSTDFYGTLAQKSDVIPLLNKYRVDIVIGDLADGSSYRSLFTSEDWAIVYLEGTYFIAVPQQVAFEKKLPILSALDPLGPTGLVKGNEQQAIDQAKNLLKEDESINAQFRLAKVLFYTQRYDESVDILQKMKFVFSPKSALFETERNFQIAQAYFAKVTGLKRKDECANTLKYLKLTEKSSYGKFIFFPTRIIPTGLHKGYAFYYLLCEGDKVRAKEHIDIFWRQPGIEDIDKLSAMDLYHKVNSQLNGLTF